MTHVGALKYVSSVVTLSRTMKVLVCAGGTGGGIYPALAAVSELERNGLHRDQVLWIGTSGEMEENLVPSSGIELETIRGGAIVGVPARIAMHNAAKLVWSIGTASKLIRRFQPDVMFMTGGYMSSPVAIAARIQRIPIGIYLPDVEPGSSIRFALPMAKKVACTSEGSRAFIPEEKMVVTGYPVRPEIREAVNLSKSSALEMFGLHPGRPTLFVFGGSRGALNINRALIVAIPELTQIRPNYPYQWQSILA